MNVKRLAGKNVRGRQDMTVRMKSVGERADLNPVRVIHDASID
jgi:hypothetical protein